MKSKLFKYFKNKLVTITVKDARMKGSNMGFMGILKEQDKEYLYLAEESDEIKAALPKSQVVSITSMDELDLLMDIPMGDQELQ